jgi:hypothetical protein
VCVRETESFINIILEKTVHRQRKIFQSENVPKKEAKRYIKDELPKKWWNGTNYSPNPCIDWVDLLQGSIYKCIKNQIGSCQPSRQHISLQQPCQRSCNISLSAHRLMRGIHNLTIKLDTQKGVSEFIWSPCLPIKKCQLHQRKMPR